MVTETQVTPTPSKYAKILTMTNFKNLMPLKLDAEKLNYSNWHDLFLVQIRGCQALEFIQPPASSSAATDPSPPTEEWLTVDSIIQSWIYLTISDQLVERVLKAKPKTAREVWELLEKIFKDNKRSKTVELVGELRSLDIGDLTVDAYFRKIDSLATRLDNLGSNITEEDLVTYAINGLSDKYDQVAHVILNRDPFPDLETVRSMVSLAETRMNRKRPTDSSSRISSSSPTALVSQTSSSRTSGTTSRPYTISNSICRNYSRGSCWYGDRCRFSHNMNTRGSGYNSNIHGSNFSQGPGYSSNTNGPNSNNMLNGNTIRGNGPIAPTALQSNMGFGPLLQAYSQLYQAHQRLLGQRGHSAQVRNSHGSNGSGGLRGSTASVGQQVRAHVDNQETTLPQAFSTLTLQDSQD